MATNTVAPKILQRPTRKVIKGTRLVLVDTYGAGITGLMMNTDSVRCWFKIIAKLWREYNAKRKANKGSDAEEANYVLWATGWPALTPPYVSLKYGGLPPTIPDGCKSVFEPYAQLASEIAAFAVNQHRLAEDRETLLAMEGGLCGDS